MGSFKEIQIADAFAFGRGQAARIFGERRAKRRRSAFPRPGAVYRMYFFTSLDCISSES